MGLNNVHEWYEAMNLENIHVLFQQYESDTEWGINGAAPIPLMCKD